MNLKWLCTVPPGLPAMADAGSPPSNAVDTATLGSCNALSCACRKVASPMSLVWTHAWSSVRGRAVVKGEGEVGLKGFKRDCRVRFGLGGLTLHHKEDTVIGQLRPPVSNKALDGCEWGKGWWRR